MLAQLKFFKHFSEGARSSDFPGAAARVRSQRGGFDAAAGLLSALPVIAALLWIPLPVHAAECVGTVSQVGAETVVSFTTPGSCTWTVPPGVIQVGQLLVVGGGGGGGCDIGGGGGAGGYLEVPNVPVSSGTQVNVVVGAGGSAGYWTPTGYISGGNGVASSFVGYNAQGGGGGGCALTPGSDGGSGGGSGYGRSSAPPCPSGGLGTQSSPGLGNNGGGATNCSDVTGGGGGGGGATAPGADYSSPSSQGGTGGAGQASSITGVQQWFAGGGGGGSDFAYSNVAASGGSGIGGNGGGYVGVTRTPPTAGAAGTGSGGGGGASGFQSGAPGGSGIVIIRYAVSASAAIPAAIPMLGEVGLTVFMLMLALAIFLVRRPMA